MVDDDVHFRKFAGYVDDSLPFNFNMVKFQFQHQLPFFQFNETVVNRRIGKVDGIPGSDPDSAESDREQIKKAIENLATTSQELGKILYEEAAKKQAASVPPGQADIEGPRTVFANPETRA